MVCHRLAKVPSWLRRAHATPDNAPRATKAPAANAGSGSTPSATAKSASHRASPTKVLEDDLVEAWLEKRDAWDRSHSPPPRRTARPTVDVPTRKSAASAMEAPVVKNAKARRAAVNRNRRQRRASEPTVEQADVLDDDDDDDIDVDVLLARAEELLYPKPDKRPWRAGLTKRQLRRGRSKRRRKRVRPSSATRATRAGRARRDAAPSMLQRPRHASVHDAHDGHTAQRRSVSPEAPVHRPPPPFRYQDQDYVELGFADRTDEVSRLYASDESDPRRRVRPSSAQHRRPAHHSSRPRSPERRVVHAPPAFERQTRRRPASAQPRMLAGSDPPVPVRVLRQRRPSLGSAAPAGAAAYYPGQQLPHAATPAYGRDQPSHTGQDTGWYGTRQSLPRGNTMQVHIVPSALSQPHQRAPAPGAVFTPQDKPNGGQHQHHGSSGRPSSTSRGAPVHRPTTAHPVLASQPHVQHSSPAKPAKPPRKAPALLASREAGPVAPPVLAMGRESNHWSGRHRPGPQGHYGGNPGSMTSQHPDTRGQYGGYPGAMTSHRPDPRGQYGGYPPPMTHGSLYHQRTPHTAMRGAPSTSSLSSVGRDLFPRFQQQAPPTAVPEVGNGRVMVVGHGTNIARPPHGSQSPSPLPTQSKSPPPRQPQPKAAVAPVPAETTGARVEKACAGTQTAQPSAGETAVALLDELLSDIDKENLAATEIQKTVRAGNRRDVYASVA